MAIGGTARKGGAIRDRRGAAAHVEDPNVAEETFQAGAAAAGRSEIFLRVAAGAPSSSVPSPPLCPKSMCSFARMNWVLIRSPGKSK